MEAQPPPPPKRLRRKKLPNLQTTQRKTFVVGKPRDTTAASFITAAMKTHNRTRTSPNKNPTAPLLEESASVIQTIRKHVADDDVDDNFQIDASFTTGKGKHNTDSITLAQQKAASRVARVETKKLLIRVKVLEDAHQAATRMLDLRSKQEQHQPQKRPSRRASQPQTPNKDIPSQGANVHHVPRETKTSRVDEMDVDSNNPKDVTSKRIATKDGEDGCSSNTITLHEQLSGLDDENKESTSPIQCGPTTQPNQPNDPIPQHPINVQTVKPETLCLQPQGPLPSTKEGPRQLEPIAKHSALQSSETPSKAGPTSPTRTRTPTDHSQEKKNRSNQNERKAPPNTHGSPYHGNYFTESHVADYPSVKLPLPFDETFEDDFEEDENDLEL